MFNGYIAAPWRRHSNHRCCPVLVIWMFLCLTSSCLANNKNDDDSSKGSTSTNQSSNFPTVPMIDIGPWMEHATIPSKDYILTPEQQTVVDEIHYACQQVGFFTIRGYSIRNVDDAWKTSRDFFASKDKYAYQTTNEVEYPYGYEASEQLTKGKQLDNDGLVTTTTAMDDEEMAAPDWKETFALGPNNLDSGMPLRKWFPSDDPKLDHLQTSLDDYYQQMEELAHVLLQIFALALEQPIDFFTNQMTHHMSAFRLVHYYPLSSSERPPPQTTTTTTSDDDDDHEEDTLVVRAGAHTDYGALTILNTQTPGLQVLLHEVSNRTNTMWYSVPVEPDALVINLGDLMQRWTNDKWVSTLHRVVMPATKAMERRYSMAFFVNINGDTTVEALDSCLWNKSSSENNNEEEFEEPRYPPITARDHLMAKHLASMGETGEESSPSSPNEARDEL